MKINLKDNRYLIAVSGGPDSMALLDIVRNKKKYLEVAHVNYHKRDSAINDENDGGKISIGADEYSIELERKSQKLVRLESMGDN